MSSKLGNEANSIQIGLQIWFWRECACSPLRRALRWIPSRYPDRGDLILTDPGRSPARSSGIPRGMTANARAAGSRAAPIACRRIDGEAPAQGPRGPPHPQVWAPTRLVKCRNFLAEFDKPEHSRPVTAQTQGRAAETEPSPKRASHEHESVGSFDAATVAKFAVLQRRWLMW